MKLKSSTLLSYLTLLATIWIVATNTSFAQNAPYVGAWEVDTFFDNITSNEMDVLRTKKILFASRSFGLNMYNGLTSLAASNSMHNILDDYIRYDVFSAGGDLSVIPTNVYENYNFVHFLATYWPHTKRIEEFETLIRDEPHSFHEDIDVAMIYFHYTDAIVIDQYTNTMNQLQADYPHIKFIYVTAGFMDINHVTENTLSATFSANMRSTYKGKAPLYDLGYILNNDDACGLGYCPDYSTDPAGVHPNTDFAQRRMGKAFLLILRDSFFGSSCTSSVPATIPANLSGLGLSDSTISLSWNESTHSECAVSRYELTRDGSFIGSTHNTNYTDTALDENSSYNYAIRSVTMADVASAYSSTINVSTLADSIPPTIVETVAPFSTQITVTFSEALNQASAETTSNYAIDNGISTLSATLLDDTVTLTTSEMTNGTTYTITINNVADASSATNKIAADSQTTFTYYSSPYPDDYDVYWPFDGSLDDISSNSADGIWISSDSYGNGLLSEGIELNGTATGDYPKVNHTAILDGMPTLSISLWAKKNDAAVGGQLFKKHVVYDLSLTANGFAGYVFNNSTERVNISGTSETINNTNWHHYCLVYDGANILFYIDGELSSSATQTGNVNTYPTQHLFIGKDPWGNAFAGNIDEMKIFRHSISSNEVYALATAGIAGHADRIAVRTLLDANGLTNKLVNSVSVYEKDRIIQLYLQEGGVHTLTSDIGQLSELTLLHCYGDRNLDYPLLSSIASEIGNCIKLEELLLNQNELTTLPSSISNLTALNIFSIGENKLCEPNPAWKAWADSYDPDWRDTQDCTAQPGAFGMEILVH